MPNRPSKRLMAARLALAVLVLALGGVLLVSSRLLHQAPPTFDGIGQTPPAVWFAFTNGLSGLGLALIALAIAATWRTLHVWRRFSPAEATGETPGASGVFRQAQTSPFSRYAVDVGICLVGFIAILAVPILFADGAPAALLTPFSIPLLIACLTGGGLVGALRP